MACFGDGAANSRVRITGAEQGMEGSWRATVARVEDGVMGAKKYRKRRIDTTATTSARRSQNIILPVVDAESGNALPQ